MAGLTVLNDVILPDSVIAAGVRGKLQRNNTRKFSDGGWQKVNVNWARTLRQYELGYIPMLPEAWQDLRGVYEVTDAGGYGFLMLDPADQSCLSTRGFMQPLAGSVAVGTLGQGYGVPTFQLFKRYAVTGSSRTKDIRITRPKQAPTLKRGAATLVYGAGAGQVDLPYTAPAVVTIVADASQAISSITVGASTVLTFANGTGMVAAMSVGERVYLTGVTGTAAATLNNLSHAITAKDAVLFKLTISTATTGLTASGGTAAKYPQAAEAMTWGGDFYVPVHFMDDALDWELVRSGPAATRLVAGPSCLLQEVRE